MKTLLIASMSMKNMDKNAGQAAARARISARQKIGGRQRTRRAKDHSSDSDQDYGDGDYSSSNDYVDYGDSESRKPSKGGGRAGGSRGACAIGTGGGDCDGITLPLTFSK